MKRRKLCNPQCRASVIRLNVGGRAFDTTRETLVGCEFFRPILEGNIGSALDVNGRIFVDPSPELFTVLLQFLRSCQRPVLDLIDKRLTERMQLLWMRVVSADHPRGDLAL